MSGYASDWPRCEDCGEQLVPRFWGWTCSHAEVGLCPPNRKETPITGKDWDNLYCGVCGARPVDCRCVP